MPFAENYALVRRLKGGFTWRHLVENQKLRVVK